MLFLFGAFICSFFVTLFPLKLIENKNIKIQNRNIEKHVVLIDILIFSATLWDIALEKRKKAIFDVNATGIYYLLLLEFIQN